MVIDVLLAAQVDPGPVPEEKKVLRRMSEQQFKSARALIKEVCCNCDSTTGGCLLLDRGEVVPCPQLISQSICCRYFRDVLLEDKRGKVLKAEIFGLDHRKVCAACGGHFQAISNRAKYCAKCAKKVRNEQAANRMRKIRA